METGGLSLAWNLCGRPIGPVTDGARAYVVSTTSVGRYQCAWLKDVEGFILKMFKDIQFVETLSDRI